MTEGEAAEPFVSDDSSPPKDAEDAAILSYYSEGNLRSDRGDPGRIRRLKDVGYLTCTVDIPTGREYLKTTPSGIYDMLLTNPMDAAESEDVRRRMRKILGGR